MRKMMRVRLEARRQILIHNDIANAAFYFKSRIEERLARNDREGIALEMVAALAMIAFAVEARFNFLGARLIPDWQERMSAIKKIKVVCGSLNVRPDFNARPYQTISELKQFRDGLAHAQPVELCFDEEVVIDEGELDDWELGHPEWERFVNMDFLSRAYDDGELIWRELLRHANLNLFETLTHGERSIHFIEHVEDFALG